MEPFFFLISVKEDESDHYIPLFLMPEETMLDVTKECSDQQLGFEMLNKGGTVLTETQINLNGKGPELKHIAIRKLTVAEFLTYKLLGNLPILSKTKERLYE